MTNTGPEHRLVCALAAVDPLPAAITSALGASGEPSFDWNRALDLAARNWVLPGVACSLARCTGMSLPEQAQSSLRLAGIAARANSSAIAAQLAPVFERWNSTGLRWGLMKGAALLATVYPPDSRLLQDVDVLVAPEEYATAREALLAAGFAPATGTHTEEFLLGAKGQVVFSNAGRVGAASTRVDLHRETYGPSKSYRFPTDELLKRRTAVEFCGQPAYALEDTDLLLHLATQLLNDRLLVKLQRLADISVLLRQVEPVESDRRAESTGSTAGLAMARAAVRQLMPWTGDVPSGNSPADQRAASTARMLIARGWPWASAFECGALPENYRRAAAGVVENGFLGELRNSLQRGREYRRGAFEAGQSTLRSLLGGLKTTSAGIGNLIRVWWESRGAT